MSKLYQFFSSACKFICNAVLCKWSIGEPFTPEQQIKLSVSQSIRQSVMSGRAFVVLGGPNGHRLQQFAAGRAVTVCAVVRLAFRQKVCRRFWLLPERAARQRQRKQYGKQAFR